MGKAIAQSDDTYLTTINLRKKFIQLKNFQTIKEQPKIETENIEKLNIAISKLQEDLTTQKTITDVISKENQEIKRQFAENEKELNMVSATIMNRIIPIVDIFSSIEGLEEFLVQFKSKKIKKITDEDVEALRQQLLEAKKRGEDDFTKRFEIFQDAISMMTKNKPKKQDKKG